MSQAKANARKGAINKPATNPAMNYEGIVRSKPAADEWHLLVGVALGIARDLRENEAVKAQAPDALKAFSLAVGLFARPYVNLQKDIEALGREGVRDRKRLTQVFNNNFAKLGGAALLLADVSRDVGGLFPESEKRKLQSLGGVLNMAAQREATGLGREEKYRQVLRFAVKDDPAP